MADALPNEGNFRITRRVLADRTNDTVVNKDLEDLFFKLEPNEVWAFEMYLFTGCSSSGGVNFATALPTNATHRTQYTGMTTASTAIGSALNTGSGSTTNFNTVGAATGWVRLHGVVEVGDTGGTFKLKFKSGTDTQVSTIFKNSYLVARRIA